MTCKSWECFPPAVSPGNRLATMSHMNSVFDTALRTGGSCIQETHKISLLLLKLTTDIWVGTWKIDLTKLEKYKSEQMLFTKSLWHPQFNLKLHWQ